MTKQEAQELKTSLSESVYVNQRSIKVRGYGTSYAVEFEEGGCGYRVETLAEAGELGFWSK